MYRTTIKWGLQSKPVNTCIDGLMVLMVPYKQSIRYRKTYSKTGDPVRPTKNPPRPPIPFV